MYGLLANVGTFLAPFASMFVQHFLELDLEHMHHPTHTTPHHMVGGAGPPDPSITQRAWGVGDHTLRGDERKTAGGKWIGQEWQAGGNSMKGNVMGEKPASQPASQLEHGSRLENR